MNSYQGYLQDGSTVAVKVLSVSLESLRGEREFISEITALSDIKHENLIKLTGCCIIGANRYLLYDYMENKSLELAFRGGYEHRRKFSWKIRRNILLGIARGLAFLHEEVKPHIVHRDIKPANILLDRNFIPKIADFGLSKLFRDNTSHVITRVPRTSRGYVAPEYPISGHLTSKSDVYSFGVLLLHLVSGLPVVKVTLEQGYSHLADKVWKEYEANNLQWLVDPTLDREFSEEEAVQVLKVGLLCVQATASLRPQMSAVVKMLEDDECREHVSISKPGYLPDFMYLKVAYKCSSDGTATVTGTASTTSSTSLSTTMTL